MKEFWIGIAAIIGLLGLGFVFGFTAGIWVVEPPQEAYDRGYEEGQIVVYKLWNEQLEETIDILKAKGWLCPDPTDILPAVDSVDTMKRGQGVPLKIE